MTKKIGNYVHRFIKCVLLTTSLLLLLCVSVGAVHLVVGLLLVVSGVSLGYYGVTTVSQTQQPFPSSKVLDVVRNLLNVPLADTKEAPLPKSDTREERHTTVHEQTENESNKRDHHSNGGVPEDSSSFSQVVNIELDQWVQYIMRDFIVHWYQTISSDDQFISDIRYTLEDVSVAIVSRARKLNPHVLLKRALITYQNYFRSYMKALRKARWILQCCSQRPCENANWIVEGYFTGWHFAVASESSEMKHLYNVVNVLLEALVPADVLRCHLSRKLLVTILARNVLHPVIRLMANPTWLNSRIALLSAEEQRCRLKPQAVVAPSPAGGDLTTRPDNLLRSATNDQEDSGLVMEASSSGSPSKCDGHQKCEDDVDAGRSASGQAAEDSTGRKETSTTGTCVPCSSTEPSDSNVQSGSEVSSVIWQRMAGELPAAFRTEREQEVRDLVEEAASFSSQTKKKSSRLPLSTSLDKLSDILYGSLSFDSISSNLAQYFKLSGDEDKTETIGQCCHENDRAINHRDFAVGASGDFLPTVNSTSTAMSDEHDKEGEELPQSPKFYVSSVLEKFLPMTTGPVLSDRVVGFGNHNVASGSKGEPLEQCSRLIGSFETGIPTQATMPNLVESPTSFDPSVVDETDGKLKSCMSEASTVNASQRGTPPPSGVFFSDIAIYDTKTIGKGTMKAHVVYCIQYDSWYQDPSSITTVDDEYVNIEPQMLRQKNNIQRRFSEFLALHKTLEEDPKYRIPMKRIKEPSRWVVLPFNKLDRSSIEDRKRALENYLKVLVSNADIAESIHLKEFLAHDMNPRIAYVKKTADINLPVPRIDRFLLKTMTGVFDKLKTALPSLPQDPSPVEAVGNLQKTSDRFRGFLNFTSGPDDKPGIELTYTFPSEYELTNSVCSQLSSFLNSYDFSDKVDLAYDAAEMDSLINNTKPPHNIKLEDGAALNDTSVRDEGESEDDMPFVNSISNFVVDAVIDEKRKRSTELLVHIVKIIFGQVLERWLSQGINAYTTDAMFSKYLKTVRDSIWPDGVLWTHSTSFQTEIDQKTSYNLALHTLTDCFPNIVVNMLGKARLEEELRLFLDSLQHPKLLRHVVYQMLDLIIDAILVQSRSQSIIEKLGTLS